MSTQEQIRARLAVKRADIEDQLRRLLDPEDPIIGTLGPIPVSEEQMKAENPARAAAIAMQRRRLNLIKRLSQMDEEALVVRTNSLIASLSQEHLANWVCDCMRIPQPLESQKAAWARVADIDARVELDLALIALGRQP